jgi:type III pantothenate kinase
MNTDDCVHNGKWLGLVGAVKEALNEAESLIGGKYDVYITGGDGLAVKSLVGKNAVLWHYRDDLVLDGLAPVLAKA